MIIHFHGTSQQGKGVFSPDPVPDVYTLSILPTDYSFSAGGGTETQVSQVTCTLNGDSTSFTAAVTSDPNGVIVELISTSGISGGYIQILADPWAEDDCKGTAEVTVTCGDKTEILTVKQNGNLNNCGET